MVRVKLIHFTEMDSEKMAALKGLSTVSRGHYWREIRQWHQTNWRSTTGRRLILYKPQLAIARWLGSDNIGVTAEASEGKITRTEMDPENWTVA